MAGISSGGEARTCVNPATGRAHISSVVLSDDLFPKIKEDDLKDCTCYWEHRVGAGADASKVSETHLEKYISIYDRNVWSKPFIDARSKAEVQAYDEEIRYVLGRVFEGSVPASCASAAEALYAIEKPVYEGGCSTIVMSIERIQDKKMLAQHMMWKSLNPGGLDSMVLHGSDAKNSNNICETGFRAIMNRPGRSLLGRGNYTTNSAKVALVYARPEGPFEHASVDNGRTRAGGAAGGAAGAEPGIAAQNTAPSGASGAPGVGFNRRAGMYTKYQQRLLLARMAHGPVETVGVRDGTMLRNDDGKIATVYTNVPDARNFRVFCTPDDAQLLVQYQVIVVVKVHEMTHLERLPSELWIFQYKPLLLMRWALNELVNMVLDEISEHHNEKTLGDIKEWMSLAKKNWDSFKDAFEDLVQECRASQEKKLVLRELKMPDGNLVSVDEAWTAISSFFKPVSERAAFIRNDSELLFKNLSDGDARFENVNCHLNVALPTDKKELDALSEMVKLRSESVSDQQLLSRSAPQKKASVVETTGMAAAGKAAQDSATGALASKSPMAIQYPLRLDTWYNLRVGYEVKIEKTWKGFERLKGMKGWIVAIWRPKGAAAVDFLVRFPEVASDQTLRKLLMKKPNQKGISYQDSEQTQLGEPLMRCRSENFEHQTFESITVMASKAHSSPANSSNMRFVRLSSYFGFGVEEQVVIRESWCGLESVVGKHGRILDIRCVVHYEAQRNDHHQKVFLLVLLDEADGVNDKLLKENTKNNNPCMCFSWKADEEKKHGRPLLLCDWTHIEKKRAAAVDTNVEASVVVTLAELSRASTNSKRPIENGACGIPSKRQKK